MAKDFAQDFYKSKAWQHCRQAYAASAGNLCEECLRENKITAGEIVHHKIHLTPDNINNPAVSLNWDNLELVCRSCHLKLHGNTKRYSVDPLGRIITR